MKFRLIFTLLLFAYSILPAQNKVKSDTVFLRYSGEIGNSKIFNTVKIYNLVDDTTYQVREYYRFTKVPRLKSRHQENIKREKHGGFEGFDIEGNPLRFGYYFNNKKHGVWSYYKKGELNYRMPYKKDKKDGEARYYFSDETHYSGYWKDDKPYGKKEKYDEDGNLIFNGAYKDGELEGLNTWYYSNGNKEKEAKYVEGKLDGVYKEWYENGQNRSEGFYKHGKKVNEWSWYNKNGKIASEEIYNKRGKIKEAIFYDSFGQTSNGKRHLREGVIDEKRQLQRQVLKQVKSNFSYPINMRYHGFEGKVWMVFRVNESGQIVNIQTRGEAHVALINEAKNIVKSLPIQKPARMHNITTEVLVALPLVFRIDD